MKIWEAAEASEDGRVRQANSGLVAYFNVRKKVWFFVDVIGEGEELVAEALSFSDWEPNQPIRKNILLHPPKCTGRYLVQLGDCEGDCAELHYDSKAGTWHLPGFGGEGKVIPTENMILVDKAK